MKSFLRYGKTHKRAIVKLIKKKLKRRLRRMKKMGICLKKKKIPFRLTKRGLVFKKTEKSRSLARPTKS